ncbi:MAG: heat shock protein Hsp90, partial [Planctomycetaceae bacterium]|nr:heat shock protein Hsp90 [Planctomycetaceae bacterium]
MSAVAEKQEFTFQTEIKQLLHLLSHSLYQNKEISIRELISNASDALDKLRHIQLTDEQYRDETPLEITIEPDKDGKILTIRDNGIGLTHDELVKNLGTIAHSGSLEFLSKLNADAKNAVSLIGQFGVGFYSAFMLADKVEVLTRSYRDTQGWRWESEGTGSFVIEPAEGVARGAQVRLHLKAELVEQFTSPFSIKRIIQKYSTFVPHPI